ncbi:MAG: phosphoglucomutase/phosphomannomutase family protein [Chlamydiae bacterium]|nr:MAG: phosphoglucomutase/phosphomannomutase family protein [Chlamydiota bacterium]
MTKIKFGTAGWRAILSDEFTFDNVKRVLDAIVLYIRQERIDRPVVVGSDTRFLAKQFREMTAEHLAKNGIDVLLTNRDCPTPVISFVIRNEKLAGGINFTASHNPPEYQGIKFSPSDGALAGTEITKTIEAMIDQPVKPIDKRGTITEINPMEDYLKSISRFLDFEIIGKAKLKIAYDALYGTGRGYLDELLKRAGADVTVIHNELNPLFGGSRPEPSKENLGELISLVRENDFNLGVSTDGDADRFGIIDSNGTFFEANKVLCLVAWHQFRNKKKTGRIVRNVATTTFLDRIAGYFGVELVEVPVGFKNIGPYVIEGNVLVGGEESAGLTIGGHVPDKDGILACALVAELIATEKKTLKEIWNDIEQAVGTGWNDRVDLELDNEKKEAILNNLAEHSKEDFLGRKVLKFNGIDGYKFTFSPSEWVLVRPSGTEPIIRCYMESDTPENGEKLKQDLMEFVN